MLRFFALVLVAVMIFAICASLGGVQISFNDSEARTVSTPSASSAGRSPIG